MAIAARLPADMLRERRTFEHGLECVGTRLRSALYRLLTAAGAVLLPVAVLAQETPIITGHVTNGSGAPLRGAEVTVPAMGIGVVTRADGSYVLPVPAARRLAGTIAVTARLIGYRLDSVLVVLSNGPTTADFVLADNPLHLGEIVVTGAGTTSGVEKLGTVRNSIDSTSIMRANEQNLVNALAAKAPNVSVVSSSGDPGASAYLQIRGLTSIQSSDGQPLIVVDGIPMDNSVAFNNEGGGGQNDNNIFPPNRLIDFNPDDIQAVEILKGASSSAIYGSRAGQGVILITTKKGRAGPTSYSLRSSWSLAEHTQLPALQTTYGQGTGGQAETCVPGAALNCTSQVSTRSFGPRLAAGTPVYDHGGEVFRTGYTTDNSLTISGGSDRTQFFLSGQYSYNRGIVAGDNNHYRRIALRFNGSQLVTDRLKVGANVAYTSGAGGFVQSRNNTGGLLLGAWRTPPEFDNLPYLEPVFGLQRSYRFPNPGPGSEQTARGYDNPFFVANANQSTSDVSRTFGGIEAEWEPVTRLKITETLGLDYSNDERLGGWAWSTSNGTAFGRGVGGAMAGYIRNRQLDHTLTATLAYHASRPWQGTITLGQNLNAQSIQDREARGLGLVAPQPFNLTNTSRIAGVTDALQKTHRESYFAQVTADLWEQLYLAAALRNDGVSSFGPDSRRSWFPKASAAWVFRRGPQRRWLTYGKLRVAYGQSGTQPSPYLLASIFISNQSGGLGSGATFPTSRLGPERVKEFEAGVDLGFWQDKADLSLTHYRQSSTNVILEVPVPTTSGYLQRPENAASLRNRGWELVVNVRPVTTRRFGWDVGIQWARNRGVTTSLVRGLQFVPFPNHGGTGGLGGLQGAAIVGQPIGVYYGGDYVRCGRGSLVDGIAIDQLSVAAGGCGQAANGALFIAADGFPRVDADAQWVLGDPNPDWTGSIRTNVRLGGLSLSGLIDIRHGGVAYNGTQGALNEFGTGLNTAVRDGPPVVFGLNYLPQLVVGPVAGPGAGRAVLLDESWWTGGASAFSPVATPFIEDGGWVKVREVSVGYTIASPRATRVLGFASVDLRLAGRNLVSWNHYSGVDPETSILGAATPIRGINYFNNPQTRSWVFSVTLRR